ncbi:MAG: cobalamin B12-binding domain-containing protein [Chloroflexi bacterium]|nr:cobalamin B12-binding domain-containing protein [Chloroflexota bacterium]
MNIEQLITAYNEAAFDTDRVKALALIHAAVNDGFSPEEIVFQVVIPALERTVASISESFDLSLAQHFMISQIAAEVTEEMIAKFKIPPHSIGRIVIGTAQGDLHSLGKQIVMGCLHARMIEFIDLGVNVSPERFVDEAVARNAPVIGISSMMVHTARGENGCLRVRQILRERHLQDRIKIIVGGAPYRFDPELYKTVQADAWALDGITAGQVITQLFKEVQ